MIATLRVYNATHSLGGYCAIVRIADNWGDVMTMNGGRDKHEARSFWYEDHGCERLFETEETLAVLNEEAQYAF